MMNKRVYTMVVTKDTESLILTPSWSNSMEEAKSNAQYYIDHWYPKYQDNYKVIEVDPKDYENAWWNDPTMVK